MNRLGTAAVAGLALIVVLVLVAGASLFTVSQTQQVLITQFGQPVRVIKDAGLHAKVPFVQTVLDFDNRLLDFNTSGEEVILADQRRLTVDSFTRYRITDPLRFFQAAGPSEDGIRGRLNSVVTSSLRRVLGNETLLNVLSADRNRIMGLIKTQVSDEMRNFGITIEDVRLRRADLPDENTQAILARMKA
ncbi:MAG: protease modulator HflC, partial [Alphaproteobacteria bacterium]